MATIIKFINLIIDMKNMTDFKKYSPVSLPSKVESEVGVLGFKPASSPF